MVHGVIRGQTAATDRDAAGNKIYDLHKADKKYKDRHYRKYAENIVFQK